MSASGIICLGWMNFSQIIDMLNMLFCFGQAIEFCAFLHLRRTRPDLPRPFKIPLGFYGMCVMLSFPLAFIGIILYFSSASSLIACVILSILGGVVYYLLEFAKSREWCHFEDKFEESDGNCQTDEARLAETEERETLNQFVELAEKREEQ